MKTLILKLLLTTASVLILTTIALDPLSAVSLIKADIFISDFAPSSYHCMHVGLTALYFSFKLFHYSDVFFNFTPPVVIQNDSLQAIWTFYEDQKSILRDNSSIIQNLNQIKLIDNVLISCPQYLVYLDESVSIFWEHINYDMYDFNNDIMTLDTYLAHLNSHMYELATHTVKQYNAVDYDKIELYCPSETYEGRLVLKRIGHNN